MCPEEYFALNVVFYALGKTFVQKSILHLRCLIRVGQNIWQGEYFALNAVSYALGKTCVQKSILHLTLSPTPWAKHVSKILEEYFLSET